MEKSEEVSQQAQDIMKDLSFALFMGASLNPKYRNLFIADRNRKIVEFFAKPISQVNKQFFKQKLHDKLPAELLCLIKEVQDIDHPISDSYGRVTQFYVMLADQTLPIYQPGSFMFESAVKEDSNISVVHGGA